MDSSRKSGDEKRNIERRRSDSSRRSRGGEEIFEELARELPVVAAEMGK